MRKRDFIMKQFNKALKKGGERAIRYIELPREFLAAGCFEATCLPITKWGDDIPVGVCVEHAYFYGEDIFTHSEYYVFR